jgi:uncharacterized protein YyaL (SSP411 family)
LPDLPLPKIIIKNSGMTNSLINESSPYLLQHANNPVNWHAWNEAALALAKKENKMLLISVGYAACHWCHVMEHESFEKEEVARGMNENYICIKVDREERPDVDQIYMNAAYLINGNGGWPLNALAMPDGKPFFAGTYFPKDNWIQLLTYFANIYKNERDKLEVQAENVAKGIREIEHIPRNLDPVLFAKSDLDEMFLSFLKRIDTERGGTRGAMKFPMPSIWEYLLRYHYFTGNKEALKSVEVTLNNMANGGIYDQVGGGFSRYATDSKWHAPHFEKMLYDNGQLVSLYSHAFQLTKNPLYKKVVYETLAFISRELTSPEGGFYSALDADSEGEEGKFYVWSQQEIGDILQNDQNLYFDLYGITQQGNWEHSKNIPDINYGEKGVAKKYDLAEIQLAEKAAALNKKLFIGRAKRIRPATDDKILTAWNALIAKGFIDAYKAFGEEEFLNSARRNLDFLITNVCTNEQSLFRNYKNGKASIFGFLDDYAFLISALIEFYQVSFEEDYLQKALSLAQYVQAHFFDEETGMFLYTDDQHSDLIARKMEVTDNVIPSSNSEMAKNLFLLSQYFENKNFEDQSIQLIKNIFADMKKNLNYYSNWAQALLFHVFPPNEIAIVGDNWKEKAAHFYEKYFPGNIYSGGEKEGSLSLLKDKLIAGKTMIYVCRNKACGMPVEDVADAINQIESSNY